MSSGRAAMQILEGQKVLITGFFLGTGERDG